MGKKGLRGLGGVCGRSRWREGREEDENNTLGGFLFLPFIIFPVRTHLAFLGNYMHVHAIEQGSLKPAVWSLSLVEQKWL